MAARQQRARKSEGPSLEALAGAVIAGPIGYLAAEGIMNDGRHPIHYVVTAVVGVMGYRDRSGCVSLASEPLMAISAPYTGVADRIVGILIRGFSVLFRHGLLVVFGWALLTVGGAVVTPWLASLGFETAAQMLYWAYRPLCPQRPDHSFFVAGHKMAFEQRETAMFVAGALVSPGHLLLKRFDIRVPGWLVFVAVLLMVVDVVTQSVAVRESTWFWRSVTGALAVLCCALWAYPKFAADHAQPVDIGLMATTERQVHHIG